MMSTSSQANLTKRLTLDAMLCVFAMLLSYLEALLPLGAIIPIPGFRLGLANVAILAVFALLSPRDAAAVAGVRIALSSLLFGSITSLYFSFLGGLCSFLVLLLLARLSPRLSFFGVSILSAAAHNIGQILAAVTLFGPFLLWSYLPALLFSSLVYGGAVGLLLNLLIPKLSRVLLRVGIANTVKP